MQKPKRTENQDGGAAIDALIDRVLHGLRIRGDLWMEELEAEWPSLVGAAVAAHTRPGRVDNGILTVFVDNSAWLSELSRSGQRPLLAALQKRFGRARIARLLLRLDPGAYR